MTKNSEIKKFQSIVWEYYNEHKRELAWRNTKDPYHIVVSEIMLQQTQVNRVKEKYEEFLRIFPTVDALANASLIRVLSSWQGLGYNRRAVNLQKMAKEVVTTYKGMFPQSYTALLALPGIGQSTAGALMNFAGNIPTPFIETNIRTVYIHHFFKDKSDIQDKELLTLIEASIDTENPREWFYALYDYGTMIKKTVGNANKKSKHYKKQSAFKGSNRELRSRILKYFIQHQKSSAAKVSKDLVIPLETVTLILQAYEKEQVLELKSRNVYCFNTTDHEKTKRH